MLIDALVSFIPPQAGPVSLVGAAGLSVPSNIIDALGLGVGQAPNVIIGNATLFGTDLGEGDDKPVIQSLVGTSFATASAATLNCAFQAAPDTGSGGAFQPGAWQTLMETGQITAAQLTAGTRFGKFDWPPSFPDNLQPRYFRLLYTVLTGTTFTAGTVASAIVTMARWDASNRFASSNYRV